MSKICDTKINQMSYILALFFIISIFFPYAVFADDVTPPEIFPIMVDPSYTSTLLAWDTDEPATTTVNYGITTAYGLATSTSVSTTSHSVVLTGLVANTIYYFQISVWDLSGNLATSTEYSFTTLKLPESPSVLVNISDIVSSVSTSTTIVTWLTDAPATSTVNYGLTSEYG